MEAFENRDIKDHILKIGDDEWESMCPYFRGVKSKGKPGEVDCNQQPTFFISFCFQRSGRPEAIPGVLVFYLLPLS